MSAHNCDCWLLSACLACARIYCCCFASMQICPVNPSATPQQGECVCQVSENGRKGVHIQPSCWAPSAALPTAGCKHVHIQAGAGRAARQPSPLKQVLIGHSMGAICAVAEALRHPEVRTDPQSLLSLTALDVCLPVLHSDCACLCTRVVCEGGERRVIFALSPGHSWLTLEYAADGISCKRACMRTFTANFCQGFYCSLVYRKTGNPVALIWTGSGSTCVDWPSPDGTGAKGETCCNKSGR